MKVSTITLDREREIAYGTKALKLVERELGRPLVALGNNVGVTETAALLYAGLAQMDDSITPEESDRLLDLYLERGEGIQGLVDAVGDALKASGWFANPTTGGK